MGAKIVWLPTLHSRHDFGKVAHSRYHTKGVAVTDDDGKVLDAVHEIFALLQETGRVLATGHTTVEQHYAVVKEFAKRGPVIVTHAGDKLAGPRLTPDQCKELADLGAFIEITPSCASRSSVTRESRRAKCWRFVAPLVSNGSAWRPTTGGGTWYRVPPRAWSSFLTRCGPRVSPKRSSRRWCARTRDSS
jgi:Family of unknown function (DUF6282)